ncbi:hypothetical protein NMG60_11008096 [Bertholletia excelsa]
MGASAAEPSLDLNSRYIPKTLSELLTQASFMAEDYGTTTSRLTGYVQMLEDEQRKIHAFQRELPICMRLLDDAIERLKEGKMRRDSGESGREKETSELVDKKNWLSSARLWSYGDLKPDSADTKRQDSVSDLKLRERAEDAPETENGFQLWDSGNKGGAFLPFKENRSARIENLQTAFSSIDLNGEGNIGSDGSGSSSLAAQVRPQSKQNLQQRRQKKQRRCWSPELHRRFLEALNRLGGAHTATPKHIRELMQVDGLTNDEVKSHLQKYRIHVRKLPASSSATSSGLWAAQDQNGEVSKANNSKSGSPVGPLQLGWPTKGASATNGESMEEDDERSTSHSWKSRLAKPVEDDL